MAKFQRRSLVANTTKQPIRRRRRGVVLTPVGLRRLQEAIQAVEIAENKGAHLTLEELGERTNMSAKTFSRLWALNLSVDQKTLKLCFNAFNLELRQEDYKTCGELDESNASEASTISLNAQPQHQPQINFKRAVSEKLHNELQVSLPYPDGPVPLDCLFYIERPQMEVLAYRELIQPGCVIKIQAPKQMGKSSLMLRLLNFAETQNYYTANLDCNQIDSRYLSNLDKFLREFCLHVARELGVDPDLDNHWDENFSSKLNCSFYFKNYLLEVIDRPVVLVVDEADRLFKYPQISHEFFSLLRSWYEEARRHVNLQKLRLVIVYSTEEYVALDINHSPFNIGLPLHLPEFTRSQVQDLAKRHGLDWSSGKEAAALMELVGGHPFLVRIALYHICAQGLSLNQLLQEAITNGGIFRNHLWSKWITLQKNPDLVEAMAIIVNTEESVCLNSIQVYKLERQGLIRHDSHFWGQAAPCPHIQPWCELYRAYFKQQLSASRK